jgi:hypothetical protein
MIHPVRYITAGAVKQGLGIREQGSVNVVSQIRIARLPALRLQPALFRHAVAAAGATRMEDGDNVSDPSVIPLSVLRAH